jgi:hypothetical protein
MTISKIKGLTKPQINKVSGISLSSIKKINSVRLEAGFSTHSIAFDGTSDYATLGTTSSKFFPSSSAHAAGNGDWSISFWIYFPSFPSYTSHNGLFGRRRYFSDLIAFSYVPTNGNIFLFRRYNNTTHNRAKPVLAGCFDANWHHIVITNDQDGGNTGMKFYRDGGLITNGTQAAWSISAFEDGVSGGEDVGWMLGRWAFNTATQFYTSAMQLDDFAIHHAVLDSDSINAMWNNGEPIDLTSDSGNYDQSSDLAYYWKFENNGTETVNNTTDSVTLFNDTSYSSTNPAGS